MAEGARSASYKFRLALALATVTLIGGLGSFGEAIDVRELWIGSGAVLILGAATVIYLTIREHRATQIEQRLERLEQLLTTRPDRQRVPLLGELTAYDLGADPEAIGSDEAAEYLPRDKDSELDEALLEARRATEPWMIVLRGPSKSGKSRTLFEAAYRDEELRTAAVVAPRDQVALAELLDDGLPKTPPGRVLLWLDDLERFVSAGHDGMDRTALDTVGGWGRPVTVVATAGGKGADEFAIGVGGMAVPIRQLYSHRRVRVVSLSSELTPDEQTRVRGRFPAEAAQQVLAHGIGEYLVAAPELARKLEDERHRPGDRECPEGAAVVWAAIDWARSGMSMSISEPLLRELWPFYLRGMQPSDERFVAGLDWALKPVYRSVALVYETSSYEAYDWIVSHADSRLARRINAQAWERMMREVDPGAAFDLAVRAYQKGAFDESRRAFRRAIDSPDGLVAAKSAFNLGYLLAEHDDLEGAREAYRRALGSDEREPAAMAGLNLGILLEKEGDLDGAALAYRRAIECEVPECSPTAALGLGRVLEQQGDVEGAAAAYAAAADSEDPRRASRAAFLLGHVLQEVRPADAADAFRRAVSLDDPEIAPAAAQLLARLRERPDLAGVRPTRGEAVVPATAAVATEAPSQEPHVAFTHALACEEAGDVPGARRAYEEVIESDDGDLGAAAAFGLGVLLGKHDEPAAAQAAYERAIASGHPKIVPAATFCLGSLLASAGDATRARAMLQRAAVADDPQIAAAATSALRELS